ncbi:hypothetical protein [Flavobacterium sp. 9AF]|uniref:hypothetical protein n=1 Tax=Flavobacterium sp. 9AF TaxID=2653142 RepID=UPI0013575783|nr:hypothetical protein [Flavobacterium sp. 9AF]
MLLITFLLKSNLYCQSLDRIKEVDTVYVFFDKSITNTHKEYQANPQKSIFYENYITYSFNIIKRNAIFFLSNTYKNTDNMREGIKNDERIEKKIFLKKNKDIILDYDFFERNGFKSTFNLLYKKTIYVIDKDEIKGKKIKVKQVDMACFDCFEE